MGNRPKALLLGVGALAAALAFSWPSSSTRDARAQPPPAVTSPLPEWIAPGASLGVRVRGEPGTRVALVLGERRRAGTTDGAGRLVLRIRAPARRGLYPVALESAGTRSPVGRLRVRPVVLAAVGDVTFGDGVGTAIARYGARYPWRHVARTLRSADVAVANLEGAVSRRGAPWPGKEFTFRGPPAALRVAARYAGIDVVSVANNHSLDYGRTAFRDTLAAARRFGVRAVGGGSNLARARRPKIVRVGGLRLAFVGFSDVRPLGFDATSGRSGTTPAFPEIVRADVRAARRRADVVVAYFHWGIERETTPSLRQRALGRIALEAGAKVVLGAHPHVLQPIERSGARRRRLVAWSLGNFVFAAHSPGTARTGVLAIRLGARGVVAHRLKPAEIHWVQPRLLR